MGRASSRLSAIGSPVSSQKPYEPSSRRLKRGVDLGDQLALPVAGPELELAFRLGAGAVGEVGVGRGLGLQILDGLAALAQDVLFPGHQLPPEILALPFVHERLIVRRPVAVRQVGRHARSLGGTLPAAARL